MIRKIAIGVGLVAVALLLLGGIKAMQIGAMVEAGENFQMPPTTVTSAQVQREDWEQSIPAVGSVTSVNGAELRAEAPGRVVEINFQSGDPVKAGDVLVRLDIETERAQLKAAEASLDLARLELDRAENLRQTRTISASEFDRASASHKEAEAQVENIRAMIDKKTVEAPFDGLAGIRRVNIGSYVSAGDPIVPLQSLDPVFIDFSLPQRTLSEIESGLRVEAVVDSFPDEVFVGRLTATNPGLNASTRMITVQATFENPDHRLRPGMFATVRVIRPQRREVLTIPSTAILHAPYGNSVFLIEKAETPKDDDDQPDGGQPELVIRQQFIRTGESRGDFTEVLSGLDEGERIVGAGVFKLRNGSPVVVDNSLKLDPQRDPRPPEG